MDEIDRFRAKASLYKQALEEYPMVRLLELYPIIWYLEYCRESIGKTKKSLKIVDLMSGTGFISDNLCKLGYKDIHAVEFCEEMYRDSRVYASSVRLHPISSFDYLEGILDEVKPDVIITLASFHHLIVYNESNEIDVQKSVDLQVFVTNVCMRTLDEAGILIIADLIDDNIVETTIEPFKYSMRSVSKKLKLLKVDEGICDLIKRSNSLHGASSLLHKEFGVKSGNISIDWFRDVVDNNTFVGHKDMAISEKFLQKVSSYRPIVTKYVCPWIFSDHDSLNDFVYKKFAFGLSPKITKEVVAEKIRAVLGVRASNGNIALGWNLGTVVLGKVEPFERDARYKTTVFSLVMIVLLTLIGILLRVIFGIYLDLSIKDIFIFMYTLPIGVLIGGIVNRLRTK